MATDPLPTLAGKSTTLRHVRERDIADRLAASYDPELTRLFGGDPRGRHSFTETDAADWHQRLTLEPFAWVIGHDGRCIGTIRLHTIEWSSRAARLAIGIFDTSQWIRGLGTEAILPPRGAATVSWA